MTPCKPTWPQCLDCIVGALIAVNWIYSAYLEVAVSLNLLFFGYEPEKPLAYYIDQAGNSPVSADLRPKLSDTPIALHDGSIVCCMLAEIKSDWKFCKDWS